MTSGGLRSPLQDTSRTYAKDTTTKKPKKPQHSPYRAQPKVYGAAAQDAMSQDDSEKLNDDKKKLLQKVIGGVLYYRRAVDLTVLLAFSSIAS